MTNSEQVAYQEMLRGCEESIFSQQVAQEDEQKNAWIDTKKEKPQVGKMCWVASPNVVLCKYQVFLAYLDNGCWYGDNGLGLGRKVVFWQYAEVPVCEGFC